MSLRSVDMCYAVRVCRWLKLAIAILATLVAVGAPLPTYARLVGGERDHACHCESRGGHAHCACPKCFPELAADDGLVAPDRDAVSGRCGDDDPGWRTLAIPAVPANEGFVVVPPLARARVARAPDTPPPQWSSAPDPRPPRGVA